MPSSRGRNRCSVAKGPCIRRRPARTHKGRRPLCLLDFDSTNNFFTSPHLLTNYLVHRRRTVFTLISHVLLRSIHGNHLFQLQMVCVMAVEAVPVSHNCLYLVPESTRFDKQLRHRRSRHALAYFIRCIGKQNIYTAVATTTSCHYFGTRHATEVRGGITSGLVKLSADRNRRRAPRAWSSI